MTLDPAPLYDVAVDRGVHDLIRRLGHVIGGGASWSPDRVFSGMHCQGVAGLVPDNAFVTVQAVLRSRILDIMLKGIPS